MDEAYFEFILEKTDIGGEGNRFICAGEACGIVNLDKEVKHA